MNTFRCTMLCLAVAGFAWGADLRVVCFGDSTTAPREGVIPYCDQIRKPGIETLNRGVRGNTTEAARERFAGDVLAAKPDVVIIQFGINDSTVDVWKSPPATAPRVTVGRFRENLAYFVDTLKQQGARVVLLTFNPLAWTPKMREMYGKPPYDPGSLSGFNTGRTEYLIVVRELATERNVAFGDVNGAFWENTKKPGQTLDDLLLDGIHPNTRGHELVSDLVRTVLANGQ